MIGGHHLKSLGGVFICLDFNPTLFSQRIHGENMKFHMPNNIIKVWLVIISRTNIGIEITILHLSSLWSFTKPLNINILIESSQQPFALDIITFVLKTRKL